MSYLADLTVRLATGLGELPESFRQRHAQYLLRAQNPDGSFSGREGAGDLYYTGFALRGLAMLGELDGTPARLAADFLRQQLHRRVAIIDFLSLVYGGMLLEMSAGIDIFAESTPEWRDAVAAALERFRRPDGGYARTEEGAGSSTYYTFLMTLCNQLIGREPPGRESIITFVRSRQRDDGGFVDLSPMPRSGTNPTAAAVGTLRVFDVLDDAVRSDVTEFLVERQNDEGGLTANTRIPLADVLSSFTGLLTLCDLGGERELDLLALRRYIESMEQPEGGFRGASLDPASDVEYTFYGLGAMGLLTRQQ